jgi:hypothetical protein
MTSIPQLRKDINDLQEKLRAAEAEIKRLRDLPPVEVVREVKVPERVVKVVEKEVPGPERVVYRDGPERVVEKRVNILGPERIVYRDVIKEVPKQVTKVITKTQDSEETTKALKSAIDKIKRLESDLAKKPAVEYRDRPVDVPRVVMKTITVEKDSDKTIAALKKARAENKKLKAALDEARSAVKTEVKTVEIPVVQYRDNPEHITMIRKLQGRE